jgi:hypothetical protein
MTKNNTMNLKPSIIRSFVFVSIMFIVSNAISIYLIIPHNPEFILDIWPILIIIDIMMTVCFRFMLKCKLSQEGISGLFPWQILKWEEMESSYSILGFIGVIKGKRHPRVYLLIPGRILNSKNTNYCEFVAMVPEGNCLHNIL